MLREVHPELDVTYFEVHADPIVAQNDVYRDAIRNADIILTQPVHEGYRGRTDLSTDWVRNEAKPGCEVIVIPALHFEGHHPGFGGLGLGNLTTCSLTAHLVAMGVPSGVIVDLLLSTDLLSEDVVKEEVRLSLQEMKLREDRENVDIPMWSIAQHIGGPTQFFHIVNHPTRPLYAHLLTKVLHRLFQPQRDVPARGKDYQSNPHVPVLPAIVQHSARLSELPDGWNLDPDYEVRVPNRPSMTQRVYYETMIAQLSEHSRDAVLSAIREKPRAMAFLGRLAKANLAIPGIDIWA